MAKLTQAALAALVNTEVDASKISVDAPFDATDVEAITGMITKIGHQYELDSMFEDRLPELEGKSLDYGTTVEEYFIDLRLPVADDPSGATNMAPRRNSFQDVAYSYQLPKYVADTTVDTVKVKKAFLGQAEFSQFTASIMKKLYDANTLHKYAVKRQLIGRFISEIPTGATYDMVKVLAKPTDTTTGEVWIKHVKNKIEELSLLITDRNNMRNVLARAESLILYVLPELTSVIDVDVLAGAFNSDKVQIPVEIKVLEDFGTLTKNVNAYALLVDPRGLKLYPSETEADSDKNGQGGFTNFYLKEAYTAVYSKVVNAHVIVSAADPQN